MSERLHLIDTLLQVAEHVDGELSIRRFRGAWRVRLAPVNHGAFRTSDAERADLGHALDAVLHQSERNVVAEARGEGHWFWSDTDPNDLDSLASDATVIMRAEQLRTLLASVDPGCEFCSCHRCKESRE